MSWWGRSQRAVWAVYYCRLLKQSHPARNAPRRNLGSVWIAGQHSFIQICAQTRLNMKRGNFLSMCACDFNTKILCSNKTVTSIWICFFRCQACQNSLNRVHILTTNNFCFSFTLELSVLTHSFGSILVCLYKGFGFIKPLGL